jgi:hypothetical protein
MSEIMDAFEEYKAATSDLAISNKKLLLENQGQMNDLEARFNAFGLTGGPVMHNQEGRSFLNVNGRDTVIVAKGERVSDFCRNEDSTPFSIGDYVLANMGFQPRAAVVSGPALVPTGVSSSVIDMVRAQSTIVAAGAGTVVIDQPTALARVSGDATVYQHTENAEDILESDISIVPVTCNPKSLVALVPLSAEVVGDSANLDLVLNTSLAAAFAAKLDVLCLSRILADTNIPTSEAAHATATWAGVMLAITAALGLDQSLPTCHIGNTGDFMARASQLASTSGTWLSKPPVLADMLELASTRLDAGTAILGNMAAAFAIIARSQLNIEVVRFAKPTSYSHLLVAHARMDGLVLQPNHLFVQKLVVA